MSRTNERPLQAHPADTPAIAGLRLRAFDPTVDYGALVALRHATSRFDGLDWLPSVEDLRTEHEHIAGFDPRLDVLVAEIDGSMCAATETHARIRDGRGSHHLDGWVAPRWRRQGLGRALLHWAEQRAATVAIVDGPAGPHDLETWIDVTQAGAVALFESAGYQVVRHGLRMIRDLAEPIEMRPLPAGLEIRPVAVADHRRIWDGDTEAFRDHWNSAERTEADYEGWFATPGLDTSLWRVAWAGDEVAGGVMTSIWPEENALLGVQRGWLEHVSVRRPWRRRGLASALMTEAILGLRAAGMREAALGVDAQNVTGAVGVYERLGFRPVRTTVKYRREL